MNTSYVLLLSCLLMTGPVFSRNGNNDPLSGKGKTPDTTGRLDEKGLKQGYWKIYGRMKALKGFGPDQVIEEGNFQNSRKKGLWKRYYPSGDLKSTITYHRSRPNGPYAIYYPNGNLQEKGTWEYNKNVGEFERYHPDGTLAQDFTFSPSGKRDGVQKYYHENGNLEVRVAVKNGKEDGIMERYYPDGRLKERKLFREGKVDPASVETFSAASSGNEGPLSVETMGAPVSPNEGLDPTEKDAGKDQLSDGYHTFYNDDGQVTRTGYFRDGKLYKGKWRHYNENGLLIRTGIYRKGIYIGDAATRP